MSDSHVPQPRGLVGQILTFIMQNLHLFIAGVIGLEPTILGLTGRSYIPLKLHPNLFYIAGMKGIEPIPSD